MCGCPVCAAQCRHGDSAPEGSVALPATTLRVYGATVWDEAASCGVSALSRRAAAVQRRWLVPCAGYESCAEGSAEPVSLSRALNKFAGGGTLRMHTTDGAITYIYIYNSLLY